MAAAAESGSSQDDEFDEYNPHPYQGGYDIALTYGHPVPPSPAICYPLSNDPPPCHPVLTDEQTPRDGVPAPEQPALPHDYSDPGYGSEIPHPEPYYSPDPLGYWPSLTPVDEERSSRRNGSDEPGYLDQWRVWRRAADYLFGYSQGYGERWAGTDSYGVPIYANKRHSDQPLVVQVDPATAQKLDYHEASREQVYPIYYETSERSGEKDYNEDIYIQADPIDPAWYQKPSYDEVYGEQVNPLPKWGYSSYDERADETHFFGTPNYAYNRHIYEEPLRVQVEPIESTLSLKPSYHEDYQEYASAEANWHTSSYGEPLEPFEPTWYRNPSYYGVYEEEVSPKSKWKSSNHEVYEEPTSPKSNWPFSLYGERGDESHVYGNPSYAYERHYHEQPLSIQLEPFKPTWSQNPIYYGVYKDELSPKSDPNAGIPTPQTVGAGGSPRPREGAALKDETNPAEDTPTPQLLPPIRPGRFQAWATPTSSTPYGKCASDHSGWSAVGK